MRSSSVSPSVSHLLDVASVIYTRPQCPSTLVLLLFSCIFSVCVLFDLVLLLLLLLWFSFEFFFFGITSSSSSSPLTLCFFASIISSDSCWLMNPGHAIINLFAWFVSNSETKQTKQKQTNSVSSSVAFDEKYTERLIIILIVCPASFDIRRRLLSQAANCGSPARRFPLRSRAAEAGRRVPATAHRHRRHCRCCRSSSTQRHRWSIHTFSTTPVLKFPSEFIDYSLVLHADGN